MGDPACWLGATCISCGRMLNHVLERDFCPHCDGDETTPDGALVEGGEPVSVNPTGSVS